MTQDEIIEMARQAGCVEDKHYKGEVIFISKDALERFAKLVAAKEREACAKVCEEHGKVWAERFLLGFQATLDDAADAIRARGEA
jgi:hypothetical protein